MSEESPKLEHSDKPEKTDPPAPDDLPPAAKKRRKWRRRLLYTLVVLVAVGLIARIVAHLLLGTVLDRVASAYGVNISFERQEVAVLGGDAGLWFVKVTPKGGGEPILTADYVRGNISIRQLLRGRLAVWRLEADGVDLALERNADGHIPILEQFLTTPAGAAPIVEVGSEKPAAEPGEIDLTSPLEIDALRFNHVRAKFRDRSVTPEFNTVVEVNLRVSDVGSGRRPTKFELDVWSDPLLDSFRVEGEGQSAGRKLDANMVVSMRGLHLEPLAEYLQPLGLRPTAGGMAMTMNAKLSTDAVPAPGKGIQATLVLENLSAITDSQEAAALDRLELKASSIDFTAMKLASLLIDGVRVYASRNSQGTLSFAGIELAPATGAGAAPAPKAAQPVAQGPAPATRPVSYRMSLDDFRLQKFKASFIDTSTSPQAEIAFLIDELTSKDVPLDRSNPDATLALAGAFSSPGLVQAIKLDGVLVPYAARKTAQINVRGDGVKLDAIKPYLDAIGIESAIDSGTFTATVDAALTTQPDGSVIADARISDVRLEDTGELVGMKEISVQSIGVDAATGRLKVDSIDVSGPVLSVNRDENGSLTAVGIRVDPSRLARPKSPAAADQSASVEPPPAAVATSTQPMDLPRVEIGRFTWKDVNIQFDDAASNPPTSLQLSDAGLEITHFVIDMELDDAANQTGKFRAWMNAPKVIEQLTAEGTITPMKSALAADATVAGQGLNFITLSPYLKPLGIEPTLADGTLAAGARINLVRDEGGVTASALLENVRYGTAEEELLALDGLLVSDLAVRENETTIGMIAIDGPRAKLSREADGGFAAAGVKILPPTTAPAPTAAVAGAPEKPLAIPQMPALPVVVLTQFQLSDAAISWSDRAINPPVETNLRAGALVSNLIVGRAGEPARFNADLAIGDSLDSLKAEGSIDASPESPNMRVNVDATGIRAGALAAYLPPGVEVTLKDGRFQSSLQAGLSKHPEGGSGVQLAVKTVEFQDKGDADLYLPLLKIDDVNVAASRIDPAGGVIAIDEISVAGAEADVLILPEGGIQAFGVALRPVAPDPNAQSVPAPQPAGVIVSTSAAGTGENVSDLVDRARKPLSLLTIDALDLNLTRFSVRDASQPDAKPLALADWRLRNVGRIELGGEDAESRPPAKVEMTGRIDPIAGSVKIDAQAAPFAQQPNAIVDITVAGIRGQGLTDILPQLKDHIDGTQLTDGRYRTHIETTMKFDRRAGDFDLSRGFDLDLHITEVAFRDSEGGPVLIGVESVQTSGMRVTPRTGGVHVKTLEITKPMGYILRDADGVHVLGWVIKLPAADAAAPTTQEGESVVVAEAAPAEPKTEEPAIVAAPPEKPAGEIRTDKLLISGIDMTLEDRAVTPVTLIPLTGLDVEVSGLTNMALVENRSIRFSAIVNAGKVELPKPVKGGGVAGAVGDIGAMLGGEKIETTPELEEREVFSQIDASGKISLYPTPVGYVRSSVSGLELAALSGEAASAGVALNGGLFDCMVDARFLEDGTIETKSKFIITEVAVSEPENGPISRHLALPAPLDAVIDIMQDADGAITIPVSVPVKQGEVKHIGGAATGAIANVIGAAVASAPAKVVGGVSGMVGLGGEEDAGEGPQPVIIPFAAGYVGLSAEDQKAIDSLIATLREEQTASITLRHELGGGDIARAEIRANPTSEASLAYARQLRARKMELLKERASLAGKARSDLATVSLSDAQVTLDQLRQLDLEIAYTENALDELYDLQRPGADRQASRRTRAAALELGRQRLDAVKAAILVGVPQAVGRVNVLNPQYTEVEGDSGGQVSVKIVGLKPKKGGWARFLRIPGT